MFINPEMFGIKPGRDVTAGFANMFESLRGSVSERTVTLSRGVYYFSADNAIEKTLCISNTVGADEYRSDESANLRRIALCIEDISNLTIDGGGCTFLLGAGMTHLAILGCSGITLKNIEIDVYKPDVHRITVTEASPFRAQFTVDGEEDYIEERGRYYWYGTGYKTDFFANRLTAWWTITAQQENYSHTLRSGFHPLRGCVSFKETAPRVFKARYLAPVKLSAGQVFTLYNARRTQVGILASSSKDVTLENVSQRFSPSLAFVAQDCENITLAGLDFSPKQSGEGRLASQADFVQISMCRGLVSIKDCNFDSAGDDVANIHGFHFKITQRDGSNITVKFCHPQSYGFECMHPGDTVAFIDSATLNEKGTAQIISCELTDPYTYVLELDRDDLFFSEADVIENISACPELEFVNNTVNRIVTRGVLVTTRKRVLIENNRFLNTGMSGVLIADDAASWYESGCVRDVTIRGNAFMNCGSPVIMVAPENRRYEQAVHSGINIENNLICTEGLTAISVKGADGVNIKNNVFRGEPKDGKHLIAENSAVEHDIENNT